MDLVYPPVVGATRLAFLGLGLRLSVTGTEHVPRQGGAVMACNHVGYLDFVFCGLAARPSRRLVRFMAKESVFRHRVSGPLMRGMHHIPVDRAAGAGSYARALRALKAGEVVGVFPEATISRSFELKAFKNGAARMAAATGTPIVPTVVWGTQRMWTKGRPRDLLTRGRAISIACGEPLHPGRRDDPDAVTAELRARMQLLLQEVQDRHPDRPAPGEDPWWLPARLGGSAPTLAEAEGERAPRGTVRQEVGAQDPEDPVAPTAP